MKRSITFASATAILALGFLAGRQTAPSPSEKSNQEVVAESRSKRTATRPPQATNPSVINDAVETASDLKGLLALVDHSDSFGTTTKLRASLANVSASRIEELITQLLDLEPTENGYITLRQSLVNHLSAKAPFRALDFVLAQEDLNFKQSFMTIVVQAAARVDLNATRSTIAEVDIPNLKVMANNALMNAPENATVEELLSLLESNPDNALNAHYNNYHLSHYDPFGSAYYGWGGGGALYNFPVAYSNGNALSKLAVKDLGAAEDYAYSIQDAQKRKNALGQIASAIAQEDPDTALEWVKGLDNSDGKNNQLYSVISNIAIQDPEKAIQALELINNTNLRNQAISSIASTWAQKDHTAAIAWLDKLPSSQSKMQAYHSIANQIAQSEPLAAIDLIQSLPGNTSQNGLPNIISQWASRDISAATGWLKTQDDPILINSSLNSVIHIWSQQDPEEAAHYINQLPKTNNNSHHFSNLASQWANKDRDAALNWANTLENGTSRDQALSGVINQWSNQDPANAAAYLDTLANSNSESGNQNYLLQSVARNWIIQDFEAAQAWIATRSAQERYDIQKSSISNLSYQQPEQAAQLFDNLTSDPSITDKQLNNLQHEGSSIVRTWSQQDPVAAAEWANTIKHEQSRSNAYNSISSQWITYDPTGAAQWIDTLPDGKSRDEAIKPLVNNVKSVDPASAFEWAETISDDNTRYKQLRDTVRQWKNTDPEAAQNAINNTDLSEEHRTKLLQQLE